MKWTTERSALLPNRTAAIIRAAHSSFFAMPPSDFVWDDADPAIMNALSTRDGNPHSGVERIIHENPF